MDPDETLNNMLKLAERIQLLIDDDRVPLPVDVHALTVYVETMDHWMRNGGFMPKRWKEAR